MSPFWKLLLLFLLIVNSSRLLAQSNAADTSDNAAVAIRNAVNTYHQFLSPQASLYNGREYVDYAHTITEGIPFFETALFSNGTVEYDGMLYEGVPLLYDEVLDELIIQNINARSKLRLNTERVTAFSLLNHHFVKLGQDSLSRTAIRPGFYDVLYQGNVAVYKKQTKKVLETISVSLGLKREIDEQDQYFIKKENTFYTVNTKHDVLDIIKDKKREIQQYIKKNKLNVRRAKEISLIKIAAYYDQLTSK